MKIKELIYQNRRDFKAIFKCEHCGHEEQINGYDDEYFHNSVIPNLPCSSCGKKAPDNYRPLQPKYPEGFQI